jgi:hypothetical protein
MRPHSLGRLVGLGAFFCAMPLARPAFAQADSGRGSVIGIAYDSVRARPLSGAQIDVDGTTLVTLAGPDGRFRIDSVPAGARLIRAHDPLLDTLGIGLVGAYRIEAGQTTKVVLATPASETLVKMFCSAAQQFLGPAALFGRVRDADTGQPPTNAAVQLVWSQLDLTGLRKVPHQKIGTVSADGSYRVCGLPRSLDGKVQVQMRGVALGGEIPVVFTDDVLRLRSLSTSGGEVSTNPTREPAAVVAAAPTPPVQPPVGTPPGTRTDTASAGPPVSAIKDTARAPAPASAAATPPAAPRTRLGRAKLSGTIVTDAGVPLAGVRVQLDGNSRATLTNQRGVFTLDSLPSGSQIVTARLLGYSPGTKEVELSASEPQTVRLSMSKVVATLTTVVAQAARDRGLDAVGFISRQKSGMGWYMDEQAIAKHGGSVFSELMRASPSVRVDPSNMGGNVIVNAREPVTGCVMFVVDGSPFQQMSPGDIDNYIRPEDVGAVEVYSGSNTPMEFQQSGMGGCLYIIIWTKFKLDRRGKR